jgi:AraC-like DNA-binding protein
MLPGCTKPAPSGLTVGAGFARALFALAVAEGAGSAALAARSGVDPAALGDPDGRIAFDAYVALMAAAKALTGNAALALRFGEQVEMSDVSILGVLPQGYDTPAEGLAALNRFSRLAIEVDLEDADRFGMEWRDGKLFLVDRRPDPNAFPELTESMFARMVCGGRRHGIDLVREVHVTHKAPAYASEYDRIFRVPIRFESGWNALELDPAALSLRTPGQPLYVQALLNDRAEALLAALEGARTLRGRVERLLAPMLPGGGATIRAVAAALGMSRQTLYRRLKLEGTTFEQVLDALRHELALRTLDDGKVSIEDAAWRTGFADRAAFSRAFKRWTGVSPKGFGAPARVARAQL